MFVVCSYSWIIHDKRQTPVFFHIFAFCSAFPISPFVIWRHPYCDVILLECKKARYGRSNKRRSCERIAILSVNNWLLIHGNKLVTSLINIYIIHWSESNLKMKKSRRSFWFILKVKVMNRPRSYNRGSGIWKYRNQYRTWRFIYCTYIKYRTIVSLVRRYGTTEPAMTIIAMWISMKFRNNLS